MTQLSPAAQAIKNAVLALDPDRRTFKWVWSLCRPIAAAVLRAAADQTINVQRSVEMWELHQKFHAIATELEAL